MMQPGQGYEFSKTQSTPGDEKAKARWEQFEKLDKARKRHEAAKDEFKRVEQQLNSARAEESNSAQALERERVALAGLTAPAATDLPPPMVVTI